MKGLLDKNTVVAALADVGLRPTCRVMVHASLSSLGVVEGGAQTVVAALREAAGPEGAVIIPSFRDAIRSDHYALSDCAGCAGADPGHLCPSRERGFTGIVGEVLREEPDALRSCHPTHSWVGVGEDAGYLLGGHYRSKTPCGRDSPFFRLMERDGDILLLGVGVSSLTNVHAVEDARNVPYLSAMDPERRHATYTTSARRLQYVYPELLHGAIREAGVIRSGKIGACLCHLIPARLLGAFLWVVTEDDPWCLALRPRSQDYRPFEDACLKVARMVRAWETWADHGDRPGQWEALLERSRVYQTPVQFSPATEPATGCPAYRGVVRGHHRCAANDVPPWEKFEDYPAFEPGVATCGQCNWPVE